MELRGNPDVQLRARGIHVDRSRGCHLLSRGSKRRWSRGALGNSLMGVRIGAAARRLLLAPIAARAAGSRRVGQQPWDCPDLPHFAPKAKRVIYLFMCGGPSHIDTFDFKPAVRDHHGEELPDSVRQGQRITGMTSGQKSFPCVAPMFEFERYGEHGTYVSEILPHVAGDRRRHRDRQVGQHRGDQPRPGHHVHQHRSPAARQGPAWAPGSATDSAARTDDPAGLHRHDLGGTRSEAGALFAPVGQRLPPLAAPGREDAFRAPTTGPLPQGPSRGRSRHAPPHARPHRQDQRTAVRPEFGDPEIRTRIAQYEMAFRMQASVPDLVDLGRAREHVRALRTRTPEKPGTFTPRNCIIARRLAERGVPFQQLFPPRLGPARQPCRSSSADSA